MKNKRYCVYKHTSPSGKIYIGVTIKKPEYRWNHGRGYKNQPYFWNAIKKYGWENFKHEILYTNLTRYKASKLEHKLVEELKANKPEFGYNLNDGGIYNYSSEYLSKKQKERFSALRQNEAAWNDFCKSQVRLGSQNAMYGKHHSEETKRKISENQNLSEEGRHNIAKATKERQLGANNVKARAVVQATKNLDFIAEFSTIREAAKSLNFINKNLRSVETYINHVCMHEKDHTSAYGYLWFYAEEYYRIKEKGE